MTETQAFKNVKIYEEMYVKSLIKEREYLRFKTVTVIGVYPGGGVIFSSKHDSKEWHLTQKQYLKKTNGARLDH